MGDLTRDRMRKVVRALGEERAGRGPRQATDDALVHLNASIGRLATAAPAPAAAGGAVGEAKHAEEAEALAVMIDEKRVARGSVMLSSDHAERVQVALEDAASAHRLLAQPSAPDLARPALTPPAGEVGEEVLRLMDALVVASRGRGDAHVRREGRAYRALRDALAAQAREAEGCHSIVGDVAETIGLTGDDLEDALNHPVENLLPAVAELRARCERLEGALREIAVTASQRTLTGDKCGGINWRHGLAIIRSAALTALGPARAAETGGGDDE